MLKNRRDTHIELRQALHPHPPKKGNDMKHRHQLIPPEKLRERERIFRQKVAFIPLSVSS